MNRMKALALGIVGVAALSGTALAADWKIDPAHSVVEFSVRHMMLANVKGTFEKIAGTVALDDKDVTKSVIDVTIDANSINTRNPARDKHLRAQDFFDVANHPALTFKSTKVEKAGKETYKVTGDLTMRGTTKPVVLQVVAPNKQIKSPQGLPTRAITATGKINRKDWGLNWNQALETGGVLVSDDVTLTIEAELNGPAGPTAAAPAK